MATDSTFQTAIGVSPVLSSLMRPRSRNAFRVRAMPTMPLQLIEGTGKAGRRLAPAVRVQQEARGRTTGSAEITRPSLREWFYGLYALSPGTGLIAPVPR